MKFYKATRDHLGPVIKNHNTMSLLRDTVLNDEIASKLPSHPSAYQAHHVEMKAAIVYKYCVYMIALYEDPGHFIHKIMAKSKTPAQTLREYVGREAYTEPVSQRTVARYLAEYKFFDAVAQGFPTEGVTEDKLCGRAKGMPPGGQGGFHMDRRGQCDHRPNFIFHQTDLKINAIRYMRGLKGTSMRVFFNTGTCTKLNCI